MSSGFGSFRLLLSMLLVIPLLAAGVDAITCESCHSSSNSSGGYDYEGPLIRVIKDPFYSPGEEFEITLMMRPQPDYSLRKMTADVVVDGSSISLVSTSSTDGFLLENGDMNVVWYFTAIFEGEATLKIDIDYEVYFKHDSAGNKDIGTYSDRTSTEVVVSDLSLGIHPGSIVLSEVGERVDVEITADANIVDIDLKISEELVGIIQISSPKNELPAGGSATITVVLRNETTAEGEITLTWTEPSGSKQVPISVSVVKLESTDRGGDLLLKVGQFTGIGAFVLLVTGYFTGGTGPFRGISNRIFGHARRRVRFHCALSYLVMILVFNHLAALWYGPYRTVVFESWEIVLGEVAMLMMIVISLNGIFQRKMIRWWGYQNWKRVHAWGSYISTSLVVVHLLTYGTHFLWFRELIGMQ